MASHAKLLRNIITSGGLFTENILLKLRDNPNSKYIGKLETILTEEEISNAIEQGTLEREKISSLEKQEKRKKIKNHRQKLYEWGQRKWEDIFPLMETDGISSDEVTEKWLIPLFNELGYDIQPFDASSHIESDDDDDSMGNFKVGYQSKNSGDHLGVFFHFVDYHDGLDDSNSSNPKNLSPHDVCQMFINFNPKIRWVVLSNGITMRLLTKYYYSYSKGFVEFNLKDIFGGDIQEFNVLYAMLHPSRFLITESEEKMHIESFLDESREEGVKIGDDLRDNVHDAIEILGNELIQQNQNLYFKVKNEAIDMQEYYAELLRVIYRMIFILYAEQRDMLPGSGSTYFKNFSLSSYRMIAERPLKNDKHGDLWKKLFITFDLLKNGDDYLQVPCFNGSLFDNKNLSLLFPEGDLLRLSNEIVIKIIRLLTTSKMGNLRQRINFIEVSEEEIGAIYESLLDFHPIFTKHGRFKLRFQTTERKGTGSYYTPKSLIDILLKTTLKPLVKDRLEIAGESRYEQEKAILDLKICDPACGGGTFLLSALDYLGEILADIRNPLESPSEEELRLARRDILQHCVYGVDKNPLAVELAKISLWLRACVKDKPLNYLDNHIKCGDSLIGVGKKPDKLIIEDSFFQALKGSQKTGIESENRELWKEIRSHVREEVKGIKGSKLGIGRMTEFLGEEIEEELNTEIYQQVISMPENTIEQIQKKEECYTKLHEKSQFKSLTHLCDAWTASFFWPLEGKFESLTKFPYPNNTYLAEIKSGKINKAQKDKIEKIKQIIEELREENKFFHWYLEFPEVFGRENSGFDLILSNPPWETLQIKEMEFFVGIDEIENAPNQSKRREQIKFLSPKKPQLFKKYKNAWKNMKKLSKYLSNSSLFDLTAKGTINTYAVFAERNLSLISPRGYYGLVCPTGIVMNYYMQDFFKFLVQKRAIVSMFDFENRNKLFDIDSRFRFCLLSLSGGINPQNTIPMTFYTHDPAEVQEPLSIFFKDTGNLKERLKKLPMDHNLIPLEPTDFELFNPNTITCLSFRQRRDVDILRKIYHNCPILVKKDPDTGEVLSNPWDISFKTMFHMANDSEYFRTEEELQEMHENTLKKELYYYVVEGTREKYYPLYEGRMIWHYNHRLSSMKFASYGMKRKAESKPSSLEELKKPDYYVTPNYWVAEKYIKEKMDINYDKKWFICIRNITGATNERTLISSLIPYSAVGHAIPLVLSNKKIKYLCILYANLSSIILDYISRIKLSGTNMSYFILEQLPVFAPKSFKKEVIMLIIEKVFNLTFTSFDLNEFAKDLNNKKTPFEWKEEERYILRSDLDAIFAHLYKIDKNQLKYIFESFFVLKRKEIEKFGEFKTKKLALKAYDKYAQQPELFK